MAEHLSLLGLPVPLALERLAAAGITGVKLIKTVPPGKPDKPGTLRVIAVRSGGKELVVSPFQDSTPTRA